MMRIQTNLKGSMILSWMTCRGSWGTKIIITDNSVKKIHIFNLKSMNFVKESRYYKSSMGSLDKPIPLLLIIWVKKNLARRSWCLSHKSCRNRKVRWRDKFMYFLILRHRNQEQSTLFKYSLRMRRVRNYLFKRNLGISLIILVV